MSLDDIIRHAEPAHAVPPAGEGSRELLDAIMSTPREAERVPVGRRWPRLRFMLPLVAAIVLVGWLLPVVPGIGPSPAAAALDIKKEGGYYVVTVKDHFADPERYSEQLRELGLDVRLELGPVSPGMVGMIFTPYDPRLNGLSSGEQARRTDLIVPIERPGACAAVERCAIGVKIPVGYRAYEGPEHRGPAVISLGRKARPGERYKGFGQLNGPGEPLQCREFAGRTVAEVVAMLRGRGVTVPRIAVPLKGARSSVPGSWYVHEGWLTEPGKALLVADVRPSRQTRPVPTDCPNGS
ncbi:hypothetical protein [Actinomadura sp. 9N407]|uniref:hypothetical protein n=1 Tax=Actinomadura sp. 9N407 TaxID=3375154 RepID=UPI00378FEF45